jgi:hypothetical protein
MYGLRFVGTVTQDARNPYITHSVRRKRTAGSQSEVPAIGDDDVLALPFLFSHVIVRRTFSDHCYKK